MRRQSVAADRPDAIMSSSSAADRYSLTASVRALWASSASPSASCAAAASRRTPSPQQLDGPRGVPLGRVGVVEQQPGARPDGVDAGQLDLRLADLERGLRGVELRERLPRPGRVDGDEQERPVQAEPRQVAVDLVGAGQRHRRLEVGERGVGVGQGVVDEREVPVHRRRRAARRAVLPGVLEQLLAAEARVRGVAPGDVAPR